MEVKNNTNESNQVLSDNRMKYLIEMIAIKKDTNMTRIYSVISKPDLRNEFNFKDAYDNPST